MQTSKNAQLGLMFNGHDASAGNIVATTSEQYCSPLATKAAEGEPRCFLLTHHYHLLHSVERGAFWPADGTSENDSSFGLPGGLVPLFISPLPAGWAEYLRSRGPHLRPVAVEIDWRVLPHDEVHCIADGHWTRRTLDEREFATLRIIAWPREVLLAAVRAAHVRSDAEREELRSMMRDFASMAPDMLALSTEPDLFAGASNGERGPSTEHDDLEALMATLRAAPEGVMPSLGLDRVTQRSIDALHGALSMLAWATPRMDGWLHLLQAILTHYDHGGTRTAELATRLGVPWLASLPIIPSSSADTAPGDRSVLLFRAAATVLMDCAPRSGLDSEQLLDRTLEVTRTLAGKVDPPALTSELRDALDTFHRAGRAVLGLDERFRSSAFPDTVQQSIVLGLLRPDPDKYRHWYSSNATIAPGAWVTGAVLVGLLRGRSGLPGDLCGNAYQQNDLAAYVANLVAHERGLARWPEELTPRLEWRSQGAGRDAQLVLESATGVWSSRAMSLRAHWLRADLDNPDIYQAAIKVAQHLAWKHCLRSVLRIPPEQPLIIEKGTAVPMLEPRGKEHVLYSRGALSIELPEHEIGYKLDRSNFMHELECAGLDPQVLERFSAPLFRAAGRLGNPAPQRAIHGIQGLDYLPAYISPDEEERLLVKIYASTWSNELKRRVQHYGWRYDYKARQVDEASRLGLLPPWADELAERLVHDGLVRQRPDQVIVNEYQPGQGISPHIDCEPCFAEDVAIISLQWAYEMEFTHPRKERISHRLDRRSLLVLRGEARYNWKHSIKGRKSDAGIQRGTRVSLTFRKVRAPS